MSLGKLREIARIFLSMGLPVSLLQATPPMSCKGVHTNTFPKSTTQRKTNSPTGWAYGRDRHWRPPSLHSCGHQYYRTLTELHSRMHLVFLLRINGEAEQMPLEAQTKIERHLGRLISVIRCDNANKFLTKLIIRNFLKCAEAMDPTSAHKPEENYNSERLIKTLKSRVRTTLISLELQCEKRWS